MQFVISKDPLESAKQSLFHRYMLRMLNTAELLEKILKCCTILSLYHLAKISLVLLYRMHTIPVDLSTNFL